MRPKGKSPETAPGMAMGQIMIVVVTRRQAEIARVAATTETAGAGTEVNLPQKPLCLMPISR